MLDGANRLPDLIKKVKANDMNALAITDHGNLYGAFEFYNSCKAAGIKPIVGFEAYIAPGSRTDRTGASRQKDAAYHLTLLAHNRTGYFNLIKLTSKAYLEGFYYKPRIDKQLLEECNEGLICLSGCVAGELSQLMLQDRHDEAEKLVDWYSKVFGDRFYLEIQNAGLDIQKQCMDMTVDLARKKGLPLVATNDAHYLNQEDAGAHDVLLCVSTLSLRSDEKRMRMTSDQFFVRTPEQMYAAFPGFEEAVAMSQVIADRCDIQLEKNPKHYPVFAPPDNLTDTQYLRKLCEEALPQRYDEVTPEIKARLDLELDVIEGMGYSSYFLIVWDFVRFAKEQDIPCGARGSACGAIVAFLLGMSNVCPLKYDLLFERFLDRSRTEPPDIDIDFCRDGRQKVIDYTKQKYGHDSVSQIGTFGTMKAKAAIRDVARALGFPQVRINDLAKLVPEELGITIHEAIKQNPDLQSLIDSDPLVKEAFEIAHRLEGLCRSAGTHAAGVVVGDGPLIRYLPLQTIAGKSDVITQWDGPHVEKAGMLKMDFLGLRNLTILHKAVQNVRKHRGIDLDPLKFPLDDPKTFALLQRGETKGIFQFEGGGIRDLLTKMKPDVFADIIATSALYRPGPLEGGMVMEYVDVKNGRREPTKVHPTVDAVLSETHGVMVYQEQVMRILNRVGGIELADAYKCIKAISKKKLETIAKFKDEYVAGAKQRGIDEVVAVKLFELIEKFAGYGFNKCVVAETVIVDAQSGERTTVGDLFHNRRPFVIHSLGDRGQLRHRSVTDVVWNGRKQVFRLTTAQGKSLTATGNHPLRTIDAWTNLADLKVGDRIAAPRLLQVSHPTEWPQHELTVLAALLLVGNTCHRSGIVFHSDNRKYIDAFAAAAAEQFPDSVVRIDCHRMGRRWDVCVNAGADTRPRSVSGAFHWAEELGIARKKDDKKFVPARVFELSDANIEHFLGCLWSGDGIVGSPGLLPYYEASSRQLGADVQLLLLRLGIQSGLHQKTTTYPDQGQMRERIGYTVHLASRDASDLFVERVSPHMIGRDQSLHRYRSYLARTSSSLASKDTIPGSVRRIVNAERQRIGVAWRDLGPQSGVCVQDFCRREGMPENKTGFRRSTIAKLAEFFDSSTLREIAESEIFWDTIVAIEPVGIRDTYDLEVEHDHNFVADGLIVHNSHSTAYGLVSYQTAYMKAHYPPEFMAALLSCGMEDSDRMTEHTDDARRMGLKVQPPDVNHSFVEFTVEGDSVRFGLAAVKGLGPDAMAELVAARQKGGPFRSIFDLTERIDPKYLAKSALETLVKAGALDQFGPNRAQHVAAIDRASQSAIQKNKDKARGQKSLFGFNESPAAQAEAEADVTLPPAEDWTYSQMLAAEKEVFGFYLTSHPLTLVADRIDRIVNAKNSELGTMEDGTEVLVGGMIGSIKKAVTKKPSRNNHTRYANFDLEDSSGIVRCIIWPEDYARESEKVVQENIVIIRGKIDRRSREPNLIVNQLMTLDDAEKLFTKHITIKFTRGLHSDNDVLRTREVLGRYPGKVAVFLLVDSVDPENPNGRLRYSLMPPQELRITPSNELQEALTAVIGRENFTFVAEAKKKPTGKAQSTGR